MFLINTKQISWLSCDYLQKDGHILLIEQIFLWIPGESSKF